MNYSNVFKALKATRSRNEKIEILRQADDFTQQVLELTYNPFKHYFINKIPKYNPIADTDLRTLEQTDFLQLTFELHTRKVSGNNALEQVKIFLKNLAPEDAEIFKNILKKDQRCGIGASTINKAIPGLIPEFGAMLAKKYDPSRYQSGLMMSLKYDGLRAIFKDGNLYTRNGHKITGAQHLTNIIPNNWSLDGELMIPDLHFQESSGLIRSDDNIPSAEYHVFDIPESTMEFTRRYRLYQDCLARLNHPQIHVVKHVKVKSEEHIQAQFQKALDVGYEGLVIKPANHKYSAKRSWSWMKLKAEHSEDLPVVGFFEGEGKYVGMLGGLIVQRKNGVLVRVGSGFSDSERSNIWQDQDSFINQIIEVAYHEITPDESLRHPVFKNFRWDKVN